LSGHIGKLKLGILVGLAAAMVAAPLPWAQPMLTFAEETPKDIVATQVRAQGHPCKDPQSAERDQAASKPDQPVWLLQCQDASYRVRLISGMAAQIQRID
jgi:hypothetical protein